MTTCSNGGVIKDNVGLPLLNVGGNLSKVFQTILRVPLVTTVPVEHTFALYKRIVNDPSRQNISGAKLRLYLSCSINGDLNKRFNSIHYL